MTAQAQDNMRVSRPVQQDMGSAPPPTDNEAKSPKALHGEIGQDVQGTANDTDNLGFKSTPEGTDVWPARVNSVNPGSPAFAQGLRAGDRILDGSVNGGRINLAVERGGKTFEIRLPDSQENTLMQGRAQSDAGPTQKATITSNQPLQATVSVQDLQKLSNHDVVIIVDRSGSMMTRDCPHGLSRWQWCGEQTLQMMHQTNGYIKDVTIVLFSTGFMVYHNCDLKKLPLVFMLNRPMGSTETAEALQSQIGEYFFRRQATHGQCKPVVIAIITDGVPDNSDWLRMSIIDATKFMRDPAEISISFLQVGKDPFGTNLLQELDSKLTREGARFDIVDTKTFRELKEEGLTKALVDAINEPHGGQDNQSRFASYPPPSPNLPPLQADVQEQPPNSSQPPQQNNAPQNSSPNNFAVPTWAGQSFQPLAPSLGGSTFNGGQFSVFGSPPQTQAPLVSPAITNRSPQQPITSAPPAVAPARTKSDTAPPLAPQRPHVTSAPPDQAASSGSDAPTRVPRSSGP